MKIKAMLRVICHHLSTYLNISRIYLSWEIVNISSRVQFKMLNFLTPQISNIYWNAGIQSRDLIKIYQERRFV